MLPYSQTLKSLSLELYPEEQPIDNNAADNDDDNDCQGRNHDIVDQF